MRARWLMWIVVAIVSFLWVSTVLGVAVRLADHGVAAWWVVLPFGLLPFAGLLILVAMTRCVALQRRRV